MYDAFCIFLLSSFYSALHVLRLGGTQSRQTASRPLPG